MPVWYPTLKGAACIKKVETPILTKDNIPYDIPYEYVIKGDAKSQTIAAASILAKVSRDRLMVSLDEKYPEYGFKQHKGYGTAVHIKAIQEYGVTDIHRKSFMTDKVLGIK